MIITETNLRHLIRRCILEAKDEVESEEEVLGEPDLTNQGQRDKENKKKEKGKSQSGRETLNDDGPVDEMNTVAAGGIAGYVAPLGDETRGSYQSQPKRKKKKRKGITHG